MTMIATKRTRWQDRTVEKARENRCCADCRYLTADPSMDNPLERVGVCRWGPPGTVPLPMQQGVALLTSLSNIADPERQWCFQFEPAGLDA